MKTAKLLVKVISIIAILYVPLCASAETPEETYTRIHNLRKADGQFQRAADAALAFMNEHPDKDIHRQKIYYEYAAALFQQQKFADAKAAFLELTTEYADTALDKSADDFFVDDAQYFAAMIEQTQGDKDIDKAITSYKALADNFPESNRRASALLTLGDLSREKKKWEESLEYYYETVSEYPESSLAADALFWANRVLCDHLDNAIRKVTDPSARYIERIDRQEEISNNITTAIRFYPTSPRIPSMLQDYIVFLVWRQSEENQQELRSVCNYIIEHYPETSYEEYAREELADLLRKGDSSEQGLAEKLLNESIEISVAKGDKEKAANWMYYKCKLLMRQRKYAEVRSMVQEAFEEAPETNIRFELKRLEALSYRFEEDFAQSRILFLKLAEEFKENRQQRSLCIFTVANICIQENNLKDAIYYFDELAEDYADLNAGSIAAERIPGLQKALESRNDN